jgi:hypothetical protein
MAPVMPNDLPNLLILGTGGDSMSQTFASHEVEILPGQ